MRPEREPEEIARRLARDPVFTFVRHPLRRAYSCFTEKVHFQEPYSFPRVRLTVANDYGARFEAQPSVDLHRENFKAFLRFSRDSFEGRNEWRRDPHWCPQSMVLQNARRWRALDFIGRVERLDAHLKVALGLAGVAGRLRRAADERGAAPALALRGDARRRGARARARGLRRGLPQLRLRPLTASC